MKKVFLLMMLTLMVLFILGTQIQAQNTSFTVTSPSWPHAISNDGTGNITFSWEIKLPNMTKSYNYFFTIYDPSGRIAYGPKVYEVPENTLVIHGNYTYEVAEGSSIGDDYTFKFNHPYPIAPEEYIKHFSVGGGNLTICKFNDSINQDGKQDDGELGLSDWTFTIIPPKGRSFDVTTGLDGTYTERNLMFGEYTITENQKSGWKSTTPTSQKANVEEHQTKPVTFGNYEVGTLRIIKFNDTNQNDKVDESVDERLRDWEFQVTDTDGKTTKYTTDNNGEIKTEVPPGPYTIKEVMKQNWKQILPIKQPVKVEVPKGDTKTVEFLNTLYPPTRLIIHKFNDTNRNDWIDEDVDERLGDWEFNVTYPSRETKKYTTDKFGEIIIKIPREYEGKEYIIEEILSPSWKQILPIKQPVKVEVPKGDTKTVEFLNTLYPPTRLIIHKFNDTNRNDWIDEDVDERLGDWEFNVTYPSRETKKYTTDKFGEIIIKIPREYEGKEYIIEEILSPSWKQILPIKQPVKVEVPKGDTKTVEFLNTLYPPTRLIIHKFNDTNANDWIDKDVDERLGNWEFNVTDPSRETKKYTTDKFGEIIIKIPREYEGKEYIIEEILSPGWKQIRPIKQPVKVAVPKGDTKTVEFLNKPKPKTGNLTIIKFYDPNQNRVQDPGDQVLAWNFSIKFPDGSIKRIRTYENGSYLLPKIPVGDYEITEEPRGCRWTNSTDMTQKVEVTGGQETIAQFRNYIAECCILPGCVWKNRDENIEVCKSVDPCSVALGKEEEEVTVHLGLCVDPKHIINGTKVENISVIDTLHSQFTIVDGSFSEEPNAKRRNPDDTTTITWDIPSLCCEEWNVSFNVTVAFALPIDVTDTSERVTSKVIYDDLIETGRRELSIPEGMLKFRFIVTPPPPPPRWCYLLGGLLLLSIVIQIMLELKRRKKEKPKEKE